MKNATTKKDNVNILINKTLKKLEVSNGNGKGNDYHILLDMILEYKDFMKKKNISI